MNEGSYTTDEIAKLLKVSKLTVYDLIKKGTLPAYRVGKQMRIDARDLNTYKNQNKMISSAPSTVHESSASSKSSIVISGQDMSLDLLGTHLEQIADVQALRSYQGSLNSLISMYQGKGDIVSVHLFDGETGAYNLPFVNRILTGRSYLVVNLLVRKAGFYVQTNNPMQLTKWSDLQKKDLILANREKGSGARVLLDEQLKIHGINPGTILGYQHEETSHLNVASTVKQGKADVGVGIEKAAKIVDTDFIPLIEEQYDLVLLKTKTNQAFIDQTLTILNSPEFKQEIKALGGYNTAQCGKILYEQ